MSDITPVNVNSPVIMIAHGSLERLSKDSVTVECTECPIGLVGPERDRTTLVTISTARCDMCAQRFEWTDLEDIKKETGF